MGQRKYKDAEPFLVAGADGLLKSANVKTPQGIVALRSAGAATRCSLPRDGQQK